MHPENAISAAKPRGAAVAMQGQKRDQALFKKKLVDPGHGGAASAMTQPAGDGAPGLQGRAQC